MNLKACKAIKNVTVLVLVIILFSSCRANAIRRIILPNGGNSGRSQEQAAPAEVALVTQDASESRNIEITASSQSGTEIITDAKEEGDDAPSQELTPPAEADLEALKLGRIEITSSPQYSVKKITDVKYGEGLSHSSWNSEKAEAVDLFLDVYLPDDGGERIRPVAIFIHGGGFTGGTKDSEKVRTMLNYFVERGFVGMSIDYRVLNDFATYPAEMEAVINASSAATTGKQRQQVRAMYGANRDAKAAIRWIYANSAEYNIDTNHITVIGGSAGSNISVALGVTNPEDFRDELSLEEDPTLASTHLEYDSTVHTVINHWGGPASVMLLEQVYGVNLWDSGDAPIHIVHGTEDLTVPFNQAEQLVALYEETGVQYAFHPLQGAGHGAWKKKVDGKTLPELAFDFVIEVQDLDVVE